MNDKSYIARKKALKYAMSTLGEKNPDNEIKLVKC